MAEQSRQPDGDMEKQTTTPSVHQFNLPYKTRTKAMIPQGAVILEILASSNGGVNIWAMVDPDATKEERFFLIELTGAEITNGWDMVYLKSFRVADGRAIHLFEVPAHIAKKMGGDWQS